MKRARERCLCVRIGHREEELCRRAHLPLGGGAHSFSETFREAAVVLFAFLLDERPPPVTYQRERRRRQQIQERLVRRLRRLAQAPPRQPLSPPALTQGIKEHHPATDPGSSLGALGPRRSAFAASSAGSFSLLAPPGLLP